MKEVLSFGAGRQSTTCLLMSCRGILPKLNAAIFADTGWEPDAVYRHLEWCKEIAAKHGIPVHVRTAGDLRADLLEFWNQRKSTDGKRHASIPAFVKNPDGSRGIVRRQCTGTYKIDVVERFIREEILGLKKGQRWPTVPTVRQWIGISADEIQLVRKTPRPALEFYYPLLEQELKVASELFPRGFRSEDCLAWIKKEGFPPPPRSACIGCPFHSNKEWAAMKRTRPDEFADACEVDRLIRENDTNRLQEKGMLHGQPFLHSSLIPLEMVDFGKASESGGMDNECSGMCGV